MLIDLNNIKERSISKKRLKTGLDILLGADLKKKEQVRKVKEAPGVYVEIDVNKVASNKKQPRKFFDSEKIKELSVSIKKQGLLMPILVRKKDNHEDKYIIVAGERRWRAANLAGLKKIKAIIVKSEEKENSLAAIIENVQREDLNVLEEAEAYNQLVVKHNMKHEDIAKNTGKSRSYITNLIRLVGLQEEVKKLLNSGELTYGHARALLASNDQEQLAKDIVKNKLSVRDTEELVKNKEGFLEKKALNFNKIKNKDPNILDYEKYLSLKLGYKVEIQDKSGKGYLLVRYKNLEQLDEIIEIFNK